MARRPVLAGLAAAALPRRARAEGAPVVIVGAGIAGLACAQALAAAGEEVLVLEARGRIGGRLHTSRLWPGLPVDLGASWIHGARGNPVTALADAAGAARVATSYDRSVMIGPAGGEVEPDLTPAEALVEGALARAERGARDLSVRAAVEGSPGWARANAGLRRLVDHHLNAVLEQEYGGPADRLSAWWGQEGEGFPGPDLLFPEGYDQLARHLARGLPLRTGAQVARIAPREVTLADGSRIAARAVVVTVPLGVLQAGDIAFAAPLAPARARAIGALGMGLLNKCWLRFDRVAWPGGVDWIEWLSPRPGEWGQWVSLARATGAPVLLGFNAAAAAEAVERLDDRATLAAATDALRAMFGSRFPAPLAAQITRWRADPFARGSYSFTPVGATPEDRTALAGADWDGALWFAGEAASRDHFGTVHGALISGRAAAAGLAQG